MGNGAVSAKALRQQQVWLIQDTGKFGGAWVAQWVKQLTLAQVTISRFTGSSPASGSVLTARSLEPAGNSVSPSLSAPPLLTLSLSLSLTKINIKKKFF